MGLRSQEQYGHNLWALGGHDIGKSKASAYWKCTPVCYDPLGDVRVDSVRLGRVNTQGRGKDTERVYCFARS
jgi:hypothetical protein